MKKLHTKCILSALLIGSLLSSCNKDEIENNIEAVETNPYSELIGTEKSRVATDKELNRVNYLTSLKVNKANCTLSGDEGCTDNARSEFVRYIRECSQYPRVWPPAGAVNTYYRSMIYYVDGDGDINLDNYQDDLQAHVDEFVTPSNPAAFVEGNILFFTCNERASNSCVILYTVYR